MRTVCCAAFAVLITRVRQSPHLTCRMGRSDHSDERSPYCGRDLALCLLHPVCVDALSLTSDQFIALRWDLRSRCPSYRNFIQPSMTPANRESRASPVRSTSMWSSPANAFRSNWTTELRCGPSRKPRSVCSPVDRDAKHCQLRMCG